MRNTDAELETIIARVAYPITRAALIEYIRLQGTGDDVVARAMDLPDRTYENPADVRQEFEPMSSN
jgi:hypothetical protein